MKVAYGDVMLEVADALYADGLDKQHHFAADYSPLELWRFDPTNHPKLYLQSNLIEDGGEAVMLVSPNEYTGATREQLGAKLKAIRAALLLPLCDRMIWFLEDELDEAEREARRRIIRAEKPSTSNWEQADLVAEVEAIAGQGRRVGRETWFRCPWHDDGSPSLEVHAEKRVWKCWGCGKAGGVVAWRKLVESLRHTGPRTS